MWFKKLKNTNFYLALNISCTNSRALKKNKQNGSFEFKKDLA